MNFSWSKEQEELKEWAKNFALETNNQNILYMDQNSEFPLELWKKYASFGVHGLIVPAKYGGLEMDFLSCIAVMEGLGYGSNDNGLLFSINAHIWSCVKPILTFGTEEQKQKYLPSLIDGTKIGVHAMTEPESGSDAFSMSTSYVCSDDGYVINGSKTMITNGNFADIVLVFAKAAHDSNKISCFIVENKTSGFEHSNKIEKMGLRTSPMSQLFFTNCKVPKENLLGSEGLGKIIFSHSMDEERAFILAAYIGTMEKQLEECINYAKKRKQFGKAIIKNQSISNLIADMKVRLEASRLLVYKVAWLKSKGLNATQDSAIAKLYTSEAFIQNSISAMKIFGGYGYMKEYHLERQLRDSLGGLFYSGTSEIMRNIISELMT